MALLVQPALQKPAPAISIHIPSAELTFERRLGGGAFGDVYKGMWQHIVVAIKRLKIHQLPPAALEDFKREAQFMYEFRHPNIVNFYKICAEPNNYCIVMEYCKRGSLYDWIRTPESSDWSTKIRIGYEVALALNHLHRHNVIHRDLKSLNVLLDEHLTAKISDFGLSKIKAENSLLSSKMPAVVGTLRWNPPELLSRQVTRHSKETDMYSYGMVLWELASGKVPFEEQHDDQIVGLWIARGQRETIPDQTPFPIRNLIERCQDQSGRRPTAEQAVLALEAQARFVPAAANPPPIPLHALPPPPGYFPLPALAGNNPPIPAVVPPGFFTPPYHPVNPRYAGSYPQNANPGAPAYPGYYPPQLPVANPIIPPPAKQHSLPIIVSGKKQWELVLGDVGEEPPLPINILQILQSPCPFWPNKKVGETHLLTLIPKTVKGEPLTLQYLISLVKSSEHRTWFGELGEDYQIVAKHGNIPVKNSYWILLTRERIPGLSKYLDDGFYHLDKHYDKMLNLLNHYNNQLYNEKVSATYEMPLLIEALASNLFSFFRGLPELYNYEESMKHNTGLKDYDNTFCIDEPYLSLEYWRINKGYPDSNLGVTGVRRL